MARFLAPAALSAILAVFCAGPTFAQQAESEPPTTDQPNATDDANTQPADAKSLDTHPQRPACRQQTMTVAGRVPAPGGGACFPNVRQYGYFHAKWRRWPEEPRPETDFPQSVGVEPVPAPVGEPIPKPTLSSSLESNAADRDFTSGLPSPIGGLTPFSGLPSSPGWGEGMGPPTESTLPQSQDLLIDDRIPTDQPRSIEPAFEGTTPGLPGLPGLLEPSSSLTPGVAPDAGTPGTMALPDNLQLPGLPAADDGTLQLQPMEPSTPRQPPPLFEGGLPGLEPLPGDGARMPVHVPEPRLQQEPPAQHAWERSLGSEAGSDVLASPEERPSGIAERTVSPDAIGYAWVNRSSHHTPADRNWLGAARESTLVGPIQPQVVHPEPGVGLTGPAAALAATLANVSNVAEQIPQDTTRADISDAVRDADQHTLGETAGELAPPTEVDPPGEVEIVFLAPPFRASTPPGMLSGGSTATSAEPPSVPPMFNGYCPVELVERRLWQPGLPEFHAVHRHRVYYLASASARDRFLSNPDRYCPSLDGLDPVLMVDENRDVSGSVEYCVDFEGQLLMFSDHDSQSRFREKPTYYAQRITFWNP